MSQTERLARETAREYALRMLESKIVSTELKPGSLLSVKELAQELGLSRTPVREALIDLIKTQIVEIEPQRGSRIALIDYEMVDESRFLRLVLEKAIVTLACETHQTLDFSAIEENLKLQAFYLDNGMGERLMEADDAFHEELFRLTRKQRTYQFLRNMMMHFDRVRSMSVWAVKETKIVDDHQQIYHAIREGDVPTAVDAITRHLTRYQVDKAALYAQYPGYFAR